MSTKHNRRPQSGPNCAKAGIKTQRNKTFAKSPLARELDGEPWTPDKSVTLMAISARFAEIEGKTLST